MKLKRKMFRAMLVAALVICGLGNAPANAGAYFKDRPQEQPTAEEQRQARELAVQFLERLKQTDDIAPLVEEMYAGDFPSRLRLDTEGMLLFVGPNVALRATPDEMLSLYTAQFNFFTMFLRYNLARSLDRQLVGIDVEDMSFEDLPADVAVALNSDPIFSRVLAEEEARKRSDDSGVAETVGEIAVGETAGSANADNATARANAKDREDDLLIGSVAELRASTAAMTKTVDALRPYTPSFWTMIETHAARVTTEDCEEISSPDLDIRAEAAFGFPAETRFISVTVEPIHDFQFQLVFVETESRLKIVTAFPIIGD